MLLTTDGGQLRFFYIPCKNGRAALHDASNSHLPWGEMAKAPASILSFLEVFFFVTSFGRLKRLVFVCRESGAMRSLAALALAFVVSIAQVSAFLPPSLPAPAGGLPRSETRSGLLSFTGQIRLYQI